MSGMPDMTSTSLAAAVAPRTGKMIKNIVFLKEEKICYKMVNYTLHRPECIAFRSIFFYCSDICFFLFDLKLASLFFAKFQLLFLIKHMYS